MFDFRNTHSPVISNKGYIDIFFSGELIYKNICEITNEKMQFLESEMS